MSHPADTPTLVVEDLRTSFATERGALKAVDGVSFALHSGQTLGVVGESGSGKSATARSIMNLLPPGASTSTGRVLLDGRDVRNLSRAESRHIWGVEASMVFQNPMTTLNPVIQIGRQIGEGLRYHRRLSREAATRRARELLEQVGIADPDRRLREYPHQLSGGMRQRVMIAIALACEPKLLIADEPTTALDVTVQKQILDLLDRLRRQHRMAMILITHDLSVVAGRTDEVIVMYAGRIVEKAPTLRLFTAMRHPYTKALFESIPKVAHPSHTRLQIIPGRPPDLAKLPAGCAFAPRCAHAQPRCLSEAPPLSIGDDTEHLFACFYPAGSLEGEAAAAANRAAGRTAGGLRLANGTGTGEEVSS
ncbi:MAG: ABC transporter ATP-binding protein [Acidimicrobiia bacterium]|nr:ABC transporter ATP-binding protein [Acidimicrobiia bacterium]